MNFKVSYIAMIAAGALSTSINAATDDARATHQINPTKEKIKMMRADKARSDSLYFVQFTDSPLANYSGDLKGYTATSIAANSANVTKNGVLNTKSASSIQYKSYLKNKQDTFALKAKRILGRDFSPKHNYQTVLNAVAVELTPAEAALLSKQKEVRAVQKAGMHYLHTASGPEFIGAKNVWAGVAEHIGTKGEGTIVGIIDTGINAYHPSFADVGGDGYDHTNPLGEGVYLGDCQTYPKFCNDKLIGIISYPEIINSYPEVINNDIEEIDEKVLIGYDFQGHGSHVASTAAGNILNDVDLYMSLEDDIGTIARKTEFKLDSMSGVAPHANIVSYQVCDVSSGCYTELTVKAVEHAIDNSINVLNYSVGGSPRSPWESLDALAFLNAREAGIHVATSAGNAGPEASTIGSPGNAPWITTVAAYTHDQSFTDKTIEGFSGGDSTPNAMTGQGATDGYTGTVVLAEDFGDAQCLTPFEEGTFNGEIVVCERGEIARVRKGLNVKEGGAGGLILINIEGGSATVNADTHLLPAIHVNATDGKTIVDWLSSGTDHTATITGAEITKDETLGDIAGYFTSRGPNEPYTNIFSPDIAGPGVDIYAAMADDAPFTEDAQTAPYSTMSGTSMSSPHVAGALALIYSVHPDWTPAQAQSAIMSTAHKLTYTDDGGDGELLRSDFFAQGAGSIRVNNAINAGLLLDISIDEYLATDPYLNGDPRTLNSTSMVDNECVTSCSWTRTVTATKDATWTASYELLNPGFELEVSPATFTLKAGESQELTITASSNVNLVDEWVHGYVDLTPSDSSISNAHFQATIAFKAGIVVNRVTGDVNNVTNEIVIEDVVTSGSSDLQTKGFGLFKAQDFSGQARASSNTSEKDSPTSNMDNLFVTETIVRPYTKRLVVKITDTTAPDMDLFVGIDEDGDGLPNGLEMFYSLVCISGHVDSNEECIIETPIAGNYWIFAHNYTGIEAGEVDDVTIEVAHITYTDDASFDIDAPIQVVADEAFDVNLTINGYLTASEESKALEANKKYYGLLEMGSTAELKRNIGSTLIELTSFENEEINLAPEVVGSISDVDTQLTDSGNVALNVDISGVFSDPESDVLTYSVSGIDGLSVSDEMISGTLTEVGSFEVIVTASDGANQASTSFAVNVEAAPIVVTPPTVTPPTSSPSSGGGSLGYFVLLFLSLASYRLRKTK
ncbi:S8 family serine peptidase [Thalassotalea eurytherma]|uniref:Dystroglycan-type cadherin-like domain-containing protein n=1 Tax=Thalassotalea eurytherma TaxID=1144278 RepID=A0ABQ6H0G5_9GAMM|nr:S8 family serine peptidase [Thalassotalea eurytherma]GLX81678.1 hypothetical protein theurythT_11300 [Thalassotalea eurytherma]